MQSTMSGCEGKERGFMPAALPRDTVGVGELGEYNLCVWEGKLNDHLAGQVEDWVLATDGQADW